MAAPATVMDEEKKGALTTPSDPQLSPKDVSPEGSVEGIDILALATDDHPAHPRNWSALKRWSILFTLCTFQAFV
jgi:hypothetical protein